MIFDSRFCRGAISLALLALFSISPAAAQSADDDWPDDSAAAIAVNEGELVFIDSTGHENTLFADTLLELDAASADSGWVRMSQCYRNLDTIAKTEITYAYREISGLRVTASENIGDIDVAAQSLLLTDVESGASVCVAARVRILRALPGGGFVLENGPYHRRFFDGYYPYHVRLALSFAESGLQLRHIEPPAQPGFSVATTDGRVEIETWFEGILKISVEFDAPDI